MDGLLRRPNMVPQCLMLHGSFSSPPRYGLHNPNAPPHYDDLLPPVTPPFVSWGIAVPIPSPQSFVLDPSPPYTPVHPPAYSEYEDSDEWFPPYSGSGYKANSD